MKRLKKSVRSQRSSSAPPPSKNPKLSRRQQIPPWEHIPGAQIMLTSRNNRTNSRPRGVVRPIDVRVISRIGRAVLLLLRILPDIGSSPLGPAVCEEWAACAQQFARPSTAVR